MDAGALLSAEGPPGPMRADYRPDACTDAPVVEGISE